MNSWNGLVAERTPDSGIAYFSEGKSSEDLLILAFIMEDGSRRFYESASDVASTEDAINTLKRLAVAEGHHKATLLKLYSSMIGKDSKELDSSVMADEKHRDIMEGGMSISKAVEWITGKNTIDILELCMSLEISAYDVYLLLEKTLEDTESKRVFKVIADEEKQHLDRLSSLLEVLIKTKRSKEKP